MVKNGQDLGNILKEDLMALLVSLDEEWCVCGDGGGGQMERGHW